MEEWGRERETGVEGLTGVNPWLIILRVRWVCGVGWVFLGPSEKDGDGLRVGLGLGVVLLIVRVRFGFGLHKD